MELILDILIGIGLASACGFRIFVPLLVMSIAALSGYLQLTPEFAWIGTYPALIVFIIATITEITAYYVPVVDNLLDTVATPIAIIAGILVTSSLIQDMSPLLRWSLAIIGGGSAAGLTQISTSAIRANSTAFTGGLGNSIINTLEILASIITCIIALFVPALILIVLAVVSILYFKRKKNTGSKNINIE